MVNPVDKYVGTQLKHVRKLAGFSQGSLGFKVGVTFQQIQKYETGANRISASTLYEFSQILNIPVSYFFEGYTNSENTKKNTGNVVGILNREDYKLVRSFNRISAPQIKKQLVEMIASIAESEEIK